MPAGTELAQARYATQRKLALDTADAGAELWRQVDFANLTGSWSSLLSRLWGILTGAQLAAAQGADAYVAAMLDAQGVVVEPLGVLRPSALAGFASDGRNLLSLLLNPVVATKEAVRVGAGRTEALAAGRASLDMTLRTQVGDAGRVAEGVAIATRPRTGWVRMLVGSSCPRCVILAGRFYRYSSGFLRHPQDDCISIPAVEDTAGDYRTDPQKAFEEGHVHGLSEADAQAIRDGADMAQVVNARRGMTVAGLTREGTSRRGLAGARLGAAPRLTPERIYREARSRQDALQLLRMNGYIV